ncbi:hypothetical protein ACOMOD_000409 [Enterococcus faecalis]|uniref:hypothetical protein n=1 Tax=Enterococcus faecalis TaxID=1351 RepID=UPI00032FA969|nr:hypothetical protein [Enterococcus faecalis]EOH64337.1 hypothetical protein UA9_01447 [Enterococcus faecalis EnGen0235]MBW4177672.1 hypothetical protein [Enterococcus faecalis]NRC62906.1 hypothetical protein [Enterococcus faecalis]NSW06746.1 hypothetical protein [Enterococcus faecalis]PQF41727.1 hypothetical protein CUS75_07775 [Enterococcus faecalis]
MKYRCIESFSVSGSNETEKEFNIEKESVWSTEEPVENRTVDVYLFNDNGSWLEINRELFDLMFEEKAE